MKSQTLFIWAVGVLMVLALAIPAGADTGDAAFLGQVKSRPFIDNWGRQITTSDQNLLTIGHETCKFLAQGATVHQLITNIDVHMGMASDSAAFVVRTAINNLCPGRWPD